MLSFILWKNLGYDLIDKEKYNKINPYLLMQSVKRKLKQFQNRTKIKEIKAESYHVYATYSWATLDVNETYKNINSGQSP